ncbi:hypothetical protein D7V97_14510 [Corallococcus sp. CA053C]|uniref:hypothetical protein n=1 Tax=Corallococcus sp. CA053C TaxID=2316732 RepID=UPI000EA0A4D0|nr:hypothetical protein [Corallococcus sp. CA053C]RKH10214.1 hypothetical protein D7V97_14510 [Corallococcus sp. CA053C]
MRSNNDVWKAAGFGVLAGMRSMTAPAFLSHELSRKPGKALKRALPALTSKKVSQRLRLMAIGELVADKSSKTPARIAPKILVGRILTGAITGAAVSRERKGAKVGLAVVGAAAAIASSYFFYGFRTLASDKLRVPNLLAGLIEDGLALFLGSRLASGLR